MSDNLTYEPIGYRSGYKVSDGIDSIHLPHGSEDICEYCIYQHPIKHETTGTMIDLIDADIECKFYKDIKAMKFRNFGLPICNGTDFRFTPDEPKCRGIIKQNIENRIRWEQKNNIEKERFQKKLNKFPRIFHPLVAKFCFPEYTHYSMIEKIMKGS